MPKEDFFEIGLRGMVTNKISGGKFKVKLIDSGVKVICTLSGKMMMNKIMVLVGDIVTVELSLYDLTRGRITYIDKK